MLLTVQHGYLQYNTASHITYSTIIVSYTTCNTIQRLTPLLLSLGQTDSQVVASSGKLNLHRDLHWVAKRTRKFPHKYTRVANKPISRQTFPIFHWLMIGLWTSLNLCWLALGGEKLALIWVQISSWPKWAQVIASHRKSTQVHARPGQTESQIGPSFQLAAPCDSVRPGL